MAPFDVFVRLCPAECDVDLVPIAGQACIPDDASRAPSRTLETFRVEFSWERPPEPPQTLMHEFADLLAQVEIVADGSPPEDDSAALLEAVRALGLADRQRASPPVGRRRFSTSSELPVRDRLRHDPRGAERSG